MAKKEKVGLKSKDIRSEQIERLKKIFPEIVADGKINFEQLKATLGEEIEDSKERFGMTWAGKSKCFRIIQDPSTGTLKPSRKESVNFDTTDNLFIEGDNLEVLKLIQKSYYEKIKMIYIDPPYNTGNDFVYNDKFGQELEEYLRITGQVDSEGKKISTSTDSSGRYHSQWMNMMYPRLFLARNLLRMDGIIFISIDDNEVDNLKKICDEIFGEENFVDTICWKKKYGGGAKEKFLVSVHEYILVYAKDKFNLPEILVDFDMEKARRFYKFKDDKFDTLGYHRTHPLEAVKSFDIRANLRFPVTAPDGKEVMPKRQWRWSKERFKEALAKDEVIFSKNKEGDWVLSSKQYLNNEMGEQRKTKAQSLIDDIFTQEGTKEIFNVFGDAKIFPFPKPTALMKRLIEIGGVSNDDIVLDFFAGSGSLPHAVLDVNNRQNKNVRFVCVQLPEATDTESEANKAGYKTIADISKERIRRVIEKVAEERKNTLKQKKLDENKTNDTDLGFKVFKLDRSNFKSWDSEPEALQTSLTDHVERIKTDSSPEEVLYEILLKDGFELATRVKEIKVKDKKVFSIEKGSLLVCLNEKLDSDLFEEMKKLNPLVVIVLDKGFEDNDRLKTNAVQTLGKNFDEEYILRSI